MVLSTPPPPTTTQFLELRFLGFRVRLLGALHRMTLLQSASDTNK